MTVNYSISILTDSDDPSQFASIGIEPYVLDFETELGGAMLTPITRDGLAKIRLNNTDGLFNPHNTTSPFYNKLLPNRRIKILVNDEIVWVGYIEMLQPSPNVTTPTATLSCKQGLELMQDIKIKNSVYKDQTARQIIENLLKDNSWVSPAAEKLFILNANTLDEDALTEPLSNYYDVNIPDGLTYAYACVDWDTETSLYDAIKLVLQAEDANLFMRRDGTLIIEPFTHRYASPIDKTFVLEKEVEKLDFSSMIEIRNQLSISHVGLVESSGVVLEQEITASPETTITTLNLQAGEGYVKKVLLSDPTPTINILSGNITISLLEVGVAGVKVQYKSNTSTDEEATIQINGTTVNISQTQEHEYLDEDSLFLYRRGYPYSINNALINSERAAATLASRLFMRFALPFSYVETIDLTDDYSVSVSDVVRLYSENTVLPLLPSNRHMILGERLIFSGTVVQVAYRLFGETTKNPVVLDVTKLNNYGVLL